MLNTNSPSKTSLAKSKLNKLGYMKGCKAPTTNDGCENRT